MNKNNSKWITIGGTLMLGMFVAYLDRSTLSVSLASLSSDLGFSGVASSWIVTAFLI